MSKIVVSEFITLDGVIHAPNEWSFPYWNDEIASFKSGEMAAAGALLLGRVTYDGFAAAWPGRTDEQGYAFKINSMPKYVVSNTLRNGSWDPTTVIPGSRMAEEITRLKQQPGEDLLVFGSGQLSQSLMRHGLVDQYNLLVYPIVLGKGRRLFVEGAHAKLRLNESRSYSSGVVLQVYQVEAQ
jgi:dihydrofolate reductase